MTQLTSHLPAKTSASHGTEDGREIHCRLTFVSLPDVATAREKVLIVNVPLKTHTAFLSVLPDRSGRIVTSWKRFRLELLKMEICAIQLPRLGFSSVLFLSWTLKEMLVV